MNRFNTRTGMDCVATGGNVKALAKAIHSLSKIGEELYLEPQDNGLALRSVNSSRSAFACFLLSPLFFQRYRTDPDHSFRCKIPIKSVQAVFKSISSLERSVEKCHIQMNSEKNRLTVALHCKHGLLKTHNLSYQDSESLQAVFDKESCANVLRAQPRLLVDAVLHFPLSQEEVTVSVKSDRVWLRNRVEDDADPSRAMMTELCLSAEEFDHFSIGAETSITFCLKELRGLLVFAESSGLPISVFFHQPGSPVVLNVSDSVLEVNFVLATLSEDFQLHGQGNKNSSAKRPQTPPPDDFMSDDMDSYLIAMETSELPGPSVDPQPCTINHRMQLGSESEEEEEEQIDRPPNKKFCSVFFGSVLHNSQLTNQTVQRQQVLASDSEDEQ